MKANLVITNSGDSKVDILNWSIRLGYGISVNQHNSYKLIKSAIKSGKKQAKKLGIIIQSIEYLDKDYRVYKLT